jgi:PAS domain S-box-containing protein
VAGKPKEESASEEGTAREAAERGSFARGEREWLLERERAARAEAEKARQETQTILESISDGFFTLDREWRFVYVNREAERFWGKPREELVGTNIREVFPRAVGNEGYRAIERAAKEGVTTEFEVASSVVPGAWVAGRAYPSAEGLSVYFQDISEHRRAEEALRESEEFVRQLLRNFPNGSVNVFDKDLRYLLAEGRSLEEEGLSSEMLVGKTLDELFPKESVDLVKPYYRRAFAGEDVGFELPLGGHVYGIHAAPLRVEDGEVRTIIAVAQDVTERKRAEEKLRESEERLWRAIGIETVGVIFFKVDGSITDSNDAFLQMSGYSREELAEGLVRWDVMTPPEWMPHSLKAIEEFESTGRTKPYEKEYVRKDGSRWWALFAATRLDDEEGVEFIIDITERKRAEEALRESEERFRTLMEQSPLAIHVFAPDGRSLRYNEAWKELWDLEESSAAPNIFVEERVRAAGLVPYLEKGAAGSEGVTDPLLYDPARTGGRGEPRWLRAFVYPVRDGSGRVFEVALTLEDVTERKRAREEHERLLAQEWKARAEAEERKRISRELHDRVAHAMAVAHQSLELYGAYAKMNPMLAAEKLQLAKESIRRALDQTRNLSSELARSHVEETRDGLVAAVRALLETHVPPGVEATLSASGEESSVPPLLGEQVYLVMREAVRNAVAHSECRRIRVNLEVRSGELYGRVEDDGAGFDPDGKQAHPWAGEEGPPHSGVGLRSMRERAGLLGGELVVASRPGQGTTVRMKTPLGKRDG